MSKPEATHSESHHSTSRSTGQYAVVAQIARSPSRFTRHLFLDHIVRVIAQFERQRFVLENMQQTQSTRIVLGRDVALLQVFQRMPVRPFQALHRFVVDELRPARIDEFGFAFDAGLERIAGAADLKHVEAAGQTVRLLL